MREKKNLTKHPLYVKSQSGEWPKLQKEGKSKSGESHRELSPGKGGETRVSEKVSVPLPHFLCFGRITTRCSCVTSESPREPACRDTPLIPHCARISRGKGPQLSEGESSPKLEKR